MSTRFRCRHQPHLRAGMLAILTLLLTGCLGNDEHWHGKDISGLMPDLEFKLINSNHNAVTAGDYRGKVRLLFFGFTSCPDVCPTTLQKLNQIIGDLPQEQQDEVLTLFVSVDPERDTPERVDEYVHFFGEGIVGLTGTEPQLRELAKRYRTTFGYDEPDKDGYYAVSHSSAVYVFDREGEARLLLRSDLSRDEIRDDLLALVQEDH